MSRRLGAWGLAVAFAGILVAACDDGGSGEDGPDGGVTLPPPDAGLPGDMNDSFVEAVPLDVDGPGVVGGIEMPGDLDYFTFEATAGQWLIVDATPVDFSSDLFPDVTLYDAQMVQLAQGFRLTHHLAVSGTFYVSVGDYFGGSGAGFEYTFTVVEPVHGQNGIFIDQESGDDAMSARAIPTSAFFSADMLGLYDHASDRDVYSFSLTGAGVKSALFFTPSPPGPQFDGSTSDFSSLWLTDATGSTVLARVDPDDAFLLPPLPSPATYLLWIEKSAAAPSTNDFYAMSVFGGDDEDPPEKETLAMPGTNDSIALAEASGEVLVLSGSPPEVFFITFLPPGDVDYLAFDVPVAVMIRAFCAASAYGSGLTGLHGEIRDASDTVLFGEDESFGGVSLDVSLPAAGRYYVRINAAGQDPVVTGNWVRCFIEIPML